MDTGDTGIQGYWTGIIEEYRRIQANTGEYRRIQENTGEYRRIQENTREYRGIQECRTTALRRYRDKRCGYGDTGIQGQI